MADDGTVGSGVLIGVFEGTTVSVGGSGVSAGGTGVSVAGAGVFFGVLAVGLVVDTEVSSPHPVKSAAARDKPSMSCNDGFGTIRQNLS